MASTSMMTLRIDPHLLALLKARAKAEGRSVSAEVVRLIQRAVAATPKKPTATMGMFSDYEAPDLGELKRLRQAASKSLSKSLRKPLRR